MGLDGFQDVTEIPKETVKRIVALINSGKIKVPNGDIEGYLKNLTVKQAELAIHTAEQHQSAGNKEKQLPANQTNAGTGMTFSAGHIPAFDNMMTMDEAVKVYVLFDDCKKRLLRPNDFQEMYKNGKVIGKYIKKSGWKKISTFFGVTVRLVEEGAISMMQDDKGEPVVIVRGYSIWNGRRADDVGVYSKQQMDAKKRPFNYPDLIATATTRCMNRCISAIVGGGEVSAEEMADYIDAEQLENQSGD